MLCSKTDGQTKKTTHQGVSRSRQSPVPSPIRGEGDRTTGGASDFGSGQHHGKRVQNSTSELPIPPKKI